MGAELTDQELTDPGAELTGPGAELSDLDWPPIGATGREPISLGHGDHRVIRGRANGRRTDGTLRLDRSQGLLY